MKSHQHSESILNYHLNKNPVDSKSTHCFVLLFFVCALNLIIEAASK